MPTHTVVRNNGSTERKVGGGMIFEPPSLTLVTGFPSRIQFLKPLPTITPHMFGGPPEPPLKPLPSLGNGLQPYTPWPNVGLPPMSKHNYRPPGTFLV